MLGQSLANVSLLRLDRLGGAAPGNKSFKLQEYLTQARQQGVTRLVSFGGAWSNHLHALAAVSQQQGFDAIGIVRGEASDTPSAMLQDARRWGMQIVHVSRSEYRMRADAQYLARLRSRFAPCLVIPEGGASPEGASGAADIARLITEVAPTLRRVVLPVGTGTTLAGIAAQLGKGHQVQGVSVLKGAYDLDSRITEMLAALGAEQCANWAVLHDHHCGGYARTSAGLRGFMAAFESLQGVQLDPVYTGKMLYAVHALQRCGAWPCDEPLLAIHTGGLQGRRGFEWCSDAPCFPAAP